MSMPAEETRGGKDVDWDSVFPGVPVPDSGKAAVPEPASAPADGIPVTGRSYPAPVGNWESHPQCGGD